MKPAPSYPDNPCLVYGFPANPPQLSPEAPLVPKDRPPNPEPRGNHRRPASNLPDSSPASSHLEQTSCGWCVFLLWSSFLAALFAAIAYFLYLISIDGPYPLLFVSGLSLSSFGVSPSSLQLNGTWHVNFSMVYNYKGKTDSYYPFDSAAVSVYYKGAYLAGADLHTFRVPKEHPLPLEVNVDASRRDVPGWLARDLAEVGRVGVMELEVQFLAKYGGYGDYYLCRNLTLGFSTADEANLIGDSLVRCPFIA